MAEYLSTSIFELVKMIDTQKLVLPAMQRDFVWPEDKITHLFDSIIRDYPIGTFLFWNIDSNTFDQYAFNKFIKNVKDNKEGTQRGEPAENILSEYYSVLDGQQRITSILVGVTGKWTTKIRSKNKKWEDPSSYYDKFLCIDLVNYPKDDEDEYQFKFMPYDYKNDKIEELYIDEEGKNRYWVKVSDVFGKIDEKGKRVEFDPSDYMDNLAAKNPAVFNDPDERKARRKMLEKLKHAILEKNTINYFPTSNSSLSEVIEMFVRVNSGGQKLSASDLMLSIASGTLGSEDVHVKMQDAINSINNSVKDVSNGFKVDKELILTAGLMFTEADSLSLQRKENYNKNRIDLIFQVYWDKIVCALENTVQYIEYLGFIGNKLTSKNLILPIGYYFYKNNIGNSHKTSTSNRASCDRIFIRQWMIRTMVNDVFLEGTGSTLVSIRSLLRNSKKKYFPLDELMEKEIKKPLVIGEEQLEEILGYEYGDARIIPLLSDLTYRVPDAYHVDHIWPKKWLMTTRAIKQKYKNATDSQIEEFKSRCHKLSNLQLLYPTENREKLETLFDEWIKENHSMPGDDYFDKNLIPTNVSYAYKNFINFTKNREKLIKQRIQNAYPDDFMVIVKKYNLQGKLK